MPGATDTRIVQMQFDNKSFERDIKTSEKSLDRFKEKLDFSKCEKSLDEFSKATKGLTFENLVNNIQKLTDKFTGLGTVSELVLSQIRRGIETTARKVSGLVNSLGFEQITAGRSKFEEMNKNVQTIIGATGEAEEEVYRVMKRLNEYTDMTSYNFTDMAANIGKFTSVGIDLRDAEKQMEGIANWAARSGAGIQEASRAMYNLSQAMGVGKMTTIDWKSIENAGMATKEFKEQLIQAGLAAGTLKLDNNGVIKTASNLGKQMEVNYQNLRETLQRGWATRAVMEKTLLNYYYDDLYYSEDKIIQLNKEQLEKNKKLLEDNKLTAEDWVNIDGISNVTDDVKQKIIDIAVEQGNLVKTTDKSGKTIYKTADKYAKKVEVSLTNFRESLSAGWLDKNVAGRVGIVEGLGEASYKAAQKCLTLTDVFNAWKDQLSTGWMKAWQKIFGELSDSMELFSAICDKVGESFSGFIKLLVGDGENAMGILGHWEALGGRDSLWSLFLGEYDGMYEGAYGFLDVLHDIGEIISRGFWEMIRVINADEIGLDTEGWYENTEYRTWFLGQKIKEATDNIQNFVKRIRDWFNEVPEGDTMSRGKKIQNFVNGLFSIVSIVFTAIKDIFHFVEGLFDQDHLGKSVDAIIDVLEALGLSIRQTGEDAAKGSGLKKLFDALLVTLKPVTDAINKIVTSISKTLVKLFSNEKEGSKFTKLWDNIVLIIDKVATVIAKVAEPILNFIGDLAGVLSYLFENGLNSESLKMAGNMLANAIGDLFGGIFGLFPGFSAKIERFFSYIFGFAEDDASEQADGSGKTIITVIKTWLRKIFGGTADFVGEFKNEMGNVSLFSIIKENLGIGLLGKLINGFAGIVKGTNLYGLIMAFLGGYSLIRLIKMLKQGGGMFSTITSFFKNLKDKSLKDIVKEKLGFSKTAETAASKLEMIAKSIALIVGAVTVLCLMPLNRLAQGVIALGVIALIIVGLIFAISKLSKNIKHADRMAKVMSSIGRSVLFITIGMALLIKALKPLADMKIEQVVSMLTGFAGILLILGLFSKYVGKMEFKGAGKIALLAIGVGILVLAIKPFADLNVLQISKMAVGLLAILAILKEFSANVTSMKKSGMGSLVMVAISVWLLLEALKPLANYNWEQLGKMAAGLVVVMAVLVLFTKGVSYMKKSGMGSLIMVAISVWLLLESLKPLATYNWGQLAKMGAGLLLIMIVLTKFTKGCESMKSTGMVQLLAVAGALWLTVRALTPLANYEWGQLAKMAAGLILLSAIIVIMTKTVKPLGILNGAGLAVMLLGLALVIAAFGFAMGSIQNASWGNIATACIGLIAILVVFALIVKQMMLMKVKDIAKALPMMLMLVALSIVIIAFSFAMNEIKKVSATKIIAFSAGLGALLLVFAIIVAALSNVSLAGALKGILILSVGLVAILGVIALIAPLLIGSIGSALTDLSGQLALVSGVIETFCGRMNNVNESDIDRSENILHRLKELFTGLAEYVGFKPSIDGFSDALYLMGTAFESFGWHMARAGDFNSLSALAFIKDLAGCANDLDTITKMNIDDLTSKITGLGGALILYARGAKDVAMENGDISLNGDDLPDVSAAIALMKAITEGLADENGIVIPENMPNEDDLGLFGAELAALAGALILFEEAGQGLGEGKDKALEVLDYFVQLRNKLEETDFVATFNTVFGSFSVEKISTSKIETFGKNIESLGSSLRKFHEDVTKVDDETGEEIALNFDSALKVLDNLVALKNRMPRIGGLKQLLVGRVQTLGDLGGELELFGQALNDLSKKVTGFDENGIQNFDPSTMVITETAVNQMVSILDTMDQDLGRVPGLFESIGQFFSGHTMNLTDLGSQMKSLGSGLGDFGKELQNGGWDKDIGADNALSALDSIMDILVRLVELNDRFEDASVYARALSDFVESFEYNIGGVEGKTLSATIAQFMKNINDAFNKYGDIDEGKITLFKTISEALNYLSGINPETDWKSLGKNIAEGVKAGIESGTAGVINSAVAMATAAYKAVKDALDINSPSEETKDLGKDTAEGMAQGIKEGTPKVTEAYKEAVTEPIKQEVSWSLDDISDDASIEDLQKVINFKPATGEELEQTFHVKTEADDTTLRTLEAISDPAMKELDVNMNITTDGDAMQMIQNATNLANNGDSIDMSVTPVLNSDGDIKEQLKEYGFDLSGGSFFNSSQTNQNANEIGNIDYTQSIDAVKNEVSYLRADVKELATAMSKFKMYVYPDAFVGAIGSEMDEYLGEQGYMSVRTEIP